MQRERTLNHRMLALLLPALLLLSTGCSLFPREEEEAPVVVAPVKTEQVTDIVSKGRIEEKVTLQAQVASRASADLFYQAGGRLKAVYVKAGEQVTGGQVLAELFADDARYQLAQAKIRLQQAELALDSAQHRSGDAHERENEIRRQELAVESARLEVDRSQAQVDSSRLTAPFSGQVMRVEAKPGDLIAAYTPLITVADPTDLWIEADVSSDQLIRLAVGQKARLEFTDPIGAGEGTIVELPDLRAAATVGGSQSRRVKVMPDKVADKARMGMVGKVSILLQAKDGVLLLPKSAIRQFGERTYVLTREPRREVDVVIGLRGETDVEIVRGLKEGDEVIGR